MEENKVYEELKRRNKELKQRNEELENQLAKSQGHREYKSRLFSFIFGREENKRWTLSLYNAIHGTSHEDVSDITINTIKDVLYMGMKNDLSILVSETVGIYKCMELYEQQSSYNPNMPVREFMYAGKLYDKFIHSARLNQYGRKLMPLPLPKLIVFYNGVDEKEDEVTLCLSDAFKEEIRRNVMHKYDEDKDKPGEEEISAEIQRVYKEANPDIEVKVRMLNINHEHNKELLAACKPLGEYAWFVEQVRKNLVTFRDDMEGEPIGIEAAIDKAIDDMPDDFEIKELIMMNRAEVKDMCLTEYNEAETMELLREEAMQEGIEKGIEESRLLDIRNLMESTGWAVEKVMDSLKIPHSQRGSLYTGLSKKV